MKATDLSGVRCCLMKDRRVAREFVGQEEGQEREAMQQLPPLARAAKGYSKGWGS